MGHGTLLLQIVSSLVAWQIVCKAERLARSTSDRAEIRALSRRLSSALQSPASTNARGMPGSNRASTLRYRIGMARLLGLDSMLQSGDTGTVACGSHADTTEIGADR